MWKTILSDSLSPEKSFFAWNDITFGTDTCFYLDLMRNEAAILFSIVKTIFSENLPISLAPALPSNL